MREVTNEEYEKALKNRDNLQILNKAGQLFRKSIPEDELYRCKLIALWKALAKYDKTKSKFTSYLFNILKYQCIDYLKENNSKGSFSLNQKKEDSSPSIEFLTEMRDCIEELPPILQKVLHQRFEEGLSFKEIGKKNCCTHETARRRYFKAIRLIRKIYFKS